MIKKLASLPLRLVKKVVKTVTGGGDASDGGAQDFPVYASAAAPPPSPSHATGASLNTGDAAADDDDGHSHSHSHGHSHDHGGDTHDTGLKEVSVWPEETPNPNAMKFNTSVKVVDQGSFSFNSAEEAKNNPLAAAIFAVGRISSVFGVNDFVTVTKEAAAPWDQLTPAVIEAIQKEL